MIDGTYQSLLNNLTDVEQRLIQLMKDAPHGPLRDQAAALAARLHAMSYVVHDTAG